VSLRFSAHSSLLAGLSILSMAATPTAAHAQDPVQKPVRTPTVTERLPAPQSITVRQTGPTEITLSWGAVGGAKSYVLGRALGNEGFRRLLDASTGPDTVYVDRQARPGLRHVYTITPINQADVAGVRATSEELVPQVIRPTSLMPIAVTASLVSPNSISLTWPIPPGTQYSVVTHWLDDAPFKQYPRLDRPGLSETDLPPGRHRYSVSAVDHSPTTIGIGQSNVIEIGAAPTPATSASVSPATAAVLVSVAAPVSLRVGSTAALPSAGQWSSLDTGVATVSADGRVTARTAGTARVVALGTSSDGAVRVTVVQVIVQP
jgi:hypothetical protein